MPADISFTKYQWPRSSLYGKINGQDLTHSLFLLQVSLSFSLYCPQVQLCRVLL